MNVFIFLVILLIALFVWIKPPKKEIKEEEEPSPVPEPVAREVKPLSLDPIHLWEEEPNLSFSLNARVQKCFDCEAVRLHPCQCEQPICSICGSSKPSCKCPGPFKGLFGQSEAYEKTNIRPPTNNWNGEPCNKRYKIERHGGTLHSLQELRKHWIATGHKNVPDLKCCCGYDGSGLNYYRDRNGKKNFCSLHEGPGVNYYRDRDGNKIYFQ